MLDKIASSPERMRNFQRERLALEIIELVTELMEENNISRSELARRLGKSRAYVTKMLSDNSNMTVKTISDVFHALNRSLRVVDRPLSVWTPDLMVVELRDFVGIADTEVEVETQRYELVEADEIRFDRRKPSDYLSYSYDEDDEPETPEAA